MDTKKRVGYKVKEVDMTKKGVKRAEMKCCGIAYVHCKVDGKFLYEATAELSNSMGIGVERFFFRAGDHDDAVRVGRDLLKVLHPDSTPGSMKIEPVLCLSVN